MNDDESVELEVGNDDAVAELVELSVVVDDDDFVDELVAELVAVAVGVGVDDELDVEDVEIALV